MNILGIALQWFTFLDQHYIDEVLMIRVMFTFDPLDCVYREENLQAVCNDWVFLPK